MFLELISKAYVDILAGGGLTGKAKEKLGEK